MDKKTKVLFVCHGNICRSPMAEAVFRDIVLRAGCADLFDIDSVATSAEELGNGVYGPAKRVLLRHGLDDGGHRSRQLTLQDYNKADHIYIMDRNNYRNIMFMTGDDPRNKIEFLLGNEEIEDPWYTGNFEKVFCQIEQGCRQVFARLKKNR